LDKTRIFWNMSPNFQFDRKLFNKGYRVGKYHVYPQLNRIDDGEITHKIEFKSMQVLLCLMERAGEPVTREELLGKAWPNVIVSDDVLSRSISILRKVFGDDRGKPEYIETIPKIGYRLIAPIFPIEKEKPGRRKIKIISAITAIVSGLLSLVYFFISTPENPPIRISSVTSFAGRESMPTISSDGRQVAFVRRDGESQDIYLTDIGADRTIRLTHHPAAEYRPAFSPDGNHIAFVRRTPDQCGIFLIPALGGVERKLTDCMASDITALAWSGDGRWIAYSDRNKTGEPYAIYLISLADSVKHRLTDPPARSFGDNDLAFSPDGTKVAFARAGFGAAEDLYVIPVGGGDPKRLTSDQRKITGLTWDADGSSIIYATDRGGHFGLWKIVAAGGSPQWMALGGQDIGSPTISRSGNRLAYELGVYDANIWRVRVSSARRSPPAPIITSTHWDWVPQYSPSEKKIAFCSDAGGSKEIWLCNDDGSNPVQLTKMNAYYVNRLRWSPDGRKIAFEAVLGNNTDIYMIDVNGGAPSRLTTHEADDSSPSWSHDGQWIYFRSNRGGAFQIWKMAVAGGGAEQITRAGGSVAIESPDGKEIFYTKQQEAGLWRLQAGGKETMILDSLEPADSLNWAVTAKGIYFIQRKAAALPAIVFFDLNRRKTRLIAPLGNSQGYYGLSISPDGQWVLYSQLDRNESDIMLLENFRP
jgi:Tol biopolymer transport system component/DNA-binding winged helix-turn-helix (wHTH) protein